MQDNEHKKAFLNSFYLVIVSLFVVWKEYLVDKPFAEVLNEAFGGIQTKETISDIVDEMIIQLESEVESLDNTINHSNKHLIKEALLQCCENLKNYEDAYNEETTEQEIPSDEEIRENLKGLWE